MERLSLVAFVAGSTLACSGAPFGGSDELFSPVPGPPCTEGCIEGLCELDYGGRPARPSADAHTPFLRELTLSCVPEVTDAQGRATEYTCFGVVPTFVTYEEGSALPTSITQSERISSGTIDQKIVMTFAWDGPRLVHEELMSFHDGVWTGVNLSWDWRYDGDAIIQLDAYTRFPEEDGPEESGNHSQAHFTDDDVETAHDVNLWDVDGRLRRHELRGGADDSIFLEADYRWAQDGRLLGATTRRHTGDPDARQEGCDHPQPGTIVCEASLQYTDDGVLVGYIDSGNSYVVSDNCCGNCTPPA